LELELLLTSSIVFNLFPPNVFPPPNFPVGEVITIENGASLSTIAKEFEDKHVIKSAGVFKTFIIALSSDTSVSGGDYLFERRLNTWEIAQRLAFGKFGIEKVSVTLPEGLTAKEMSEILGTKLPSFNKEEFLFLTKEARRHRGTVKRPSAAF
jgi:UPF0755 protein